MRTLLTLSLSLAMTLTILCGAQSFASDRDEAAKQQEREARDRQRAAERAQEAADKAERRSAEDADKRGREGSRKDTRALADGDATDKSGPKQEHHGGAEWRALERDRDNHAYRARELVVLADEVGFEADANELGFATLERQALDEIGSTLWRLRAPEGMSTSGALATLRAAAPNVVSALNHVLRPDAPTGGLSEDNASAARAIRSGSIVGVIDGFASDTVQGWMVRRATSAPARSGHGDAVATILLSEMVDRYQRAPASLILDDVVSLTGSEAYADVATIALSLNNMAKSKADVVNISLSGPDNAVLALAVARVLARGVVLVAAGGNGGPAAPPVYPAAYPGVIGVAALDDTGRPWMYSSRGAHIDAAALGSGPVAASTRRKDMGTSFAAPRVAAFLAANRLESESTDALLAANARDAGPPGRDPIYGVGIIGFAAAPEKADRR